MHTYMYTDFYMTYIYIHTPNALSEKWGKWVSLLKCWSHSRYHLCSETLQKPHISQNEIQKPGSAKPFIIFMGPSLISQRPFLPHSSYHFITVILDFLLFLQHIPSSSHFAYTVRSAWNGSFHRELLPAKYNFYHTGFPDHPFSLPYLCLLTLKPPAALCMYHAFPAYPILTTSPWLQVLCHIHSEPRTASESSRVFIDWKGWADFIGLDCCQS